MASSDTGNKKPATSRGAKRSADAKEPPAETTSPTTTGNGSARLTAASAATAGLSGIAQLTGKQPEGVTGVEPTSNGWVISVEVIEDRHVPSTADILATYEAELAADGTLLAYHRTSRYMRGRPDGRGMRG